MGVLYRLRRSVALMICPEMGAEARSMEASLSLDQAIRLNAREEDARKFLFPVSPRLRFSRDHGCSREAKFAAPKEPFLPDSDMADLLEPLRHSRIERAKQELVEDLTGAALLFGVLFATLCVGGW